MSEDQLIADVVGLLLDWKDGALKVSDEAFAEMLIEEICSKSDDVWSITFTPETFH